MGNRPVSHRPFTESRPDLLTHIYVLVPVLDAEKHYWVGEDEVEKLLRKGEGWLASHPERETIVKRYLRFDRNLTRSALARLVEEDTSDPQAEELRHANEEEWIEASVKLGSNALGLSYLLCADQAQRQWSIWAVVKASF